MNTLLSKNIEVQRSATKMIIAENPVEITIVRKIYVNLPDGGREEQARTLPPFAGRIVPSKQQVSKSRSEAGETQTSNWILISPWDTDIKSDSSVVDTFQAIGKTFRVTRVIPRRLRGLVCSTHAILEEVK